ncbi:MAG: hypothetical protein KKB20_23985 [Proteobacteria bacterium]|nr:hypothetical protein [Pseudomonadota bacterium]
MELGLLDRIRTRPEGDEDFSARKLDGFVQYEPRPFSTLEIEPTTRCNLFCPSCPRVTYQACWIDQDMSMETFELVSRAFNRFDTIHFRGWGEPQLNQAFPEMVRRAYQSGARLVLTTNGVRRLDPGLAAYFRAIIFRLDYARASTYERRNPGVRFNRVIFNISHVLHHRDSNGLSRPAVILLLAKNKFSLTELPSYLDTAIRLCPDQVILYHPYFHVRGVDERGCLPSDLAPDLIDHIDHVLDTEARQADLDMVNMPLDGHPALECGFDPERDVFVNWAGRTSICRNTALPVASGTFVRIYRGREEFLTTHLFGSLLDRPIEEIIGDRSYRHFVRGCLDAKMNDGRPDSGPNGHAVLRPAGADRCPNHSGERLRSCLCRGRRPAE